MYRYIQEKYQEEKDRVISSVKRDYKWLYKPQQF